MSRIRKEYIECRLFILGDENVGKKSFVKKLLSLPCTGLVHDSFSEKEYETLYSKYKSAVEEDKLLQKQNEELLQSMNKEQKVKKNNDITSRFDSTNTLFKIDEERTLRKTNSNFAKNEKTNRNVTTTLKNVKDTNNLSSSIGIKPGIYKQKILREPVPEYPGKLFCVDLDKIVLKIFYIPKGEKRPPDYAPIDEDEEYELEKEHNISFDGIKNDLNNKLSLKDTCIPQDKLSDYNVSIFTLFIFLYDMSNFYSFESLILYYSKIAKLFRFGEEENFKSCIIGNKIDKKVMMETEQLSVFNEFLKNTNLKKFEMSTKPYFYFNRFFSEFFFQMFSLFEQNETEPNQKLLEKENFIEKFNKLIKSHSNFSKGKREDPGQSKKVPGPEYDLNLFSFGSEEERNQVFTDQKYRFNKKIFANKNGPIFHDDIFVKNAGDKKKDDEFGFIEIKGGVFNKPVNGFSFGVVNGKLNLLQKRRELRDKRNSGLNAIIDRYNNSPIHKSPLKKSRDEEYFENALKKKILYKQNIIQERQLKIGKILSIHNENIKKLEEEKQNRNQKLLLKKSASTPNLLLNSITTSENIIKEKERNILRQRYHDAIYGKNQINLEKYNQQLYKIRLLSSMKKEPEPYYIDIRENMLNPSKGIKMHEESGISRRMKNSENYPKYRLIKDDFDRIVENSLKKKFNLNSTKSLKMTENEKLKKQKREERLIELEQKNLENLEKKEEKRNRWISLKEENNLLKKKQMQDLQAAKFLKHQKLMEEEEDKQKIISDLRRDISIQKGYGDPYVINPINYSLVEDSSPKYSIKGRYVVRKPRGDDLKDLILGTNIDEINQIKELQKNQSLPNFNYVKPNMPRTVFNRAERFPKEKNYNDDTMPLPLFNDGIFKPLEHKDFICKEPMNDQSQRGNFISAYSKSPSPAEYKMKSSFDEIVEKGSKINKARNKIKMENAMNEKNNKEKKIKSK